ncbi:hypothetical protein FNV43_RR02145 [Rhamnella rubrinervis]|uniref:EF-hand domain-containing protein n=1 Tax=Rhamnella rubrinervis TaxID=2594499 RepID=A0A8K0HQX9_9ROSA|nr:hypothetical protein FNV43_RR02145 [Rhamnella rubrinervis]
MEDTSSANRTLYFLLWVFVDLFFIHTVSNWANSIRKFVPKFKSFLQPKLDLGSSKYRAEKSFEPELFSYSQQQVCVNRKDDGNLSREDVKIVMGKLGIFCSPESEELHEWFGSDELSRLYEEEPSLEEVKEAFDMFDENRDGFIDEKELQRVFCILGLKQGSEIENCKNMIGSFDENRDGRIDFNEFVTLMETSF